MPNPKTCSPCRLNTSCIKAGRYLKWKHPLIISLHPLSISAQGINHHVQYTKQKRQENVKEKGGENNDRINFPYVSITRIFNWEMFDDHLEFIVSFLEWRNKFQRIKSQQKRRKMYEGDPSGGRHHHTIKAAWGGCGELGFEGWSSSAPHSTC